MDAIKFWFLNLFRRIDALERRVFHAAESVRLRYALERQRELEDEVQRLAEDASEALKRYDRQARIDRDNFIARLEIKDIAKRRELITLEHDIRLMQEELGEKQPC